MNFIAGVVASARKYADTVIVIDDGSHDGTPEAARAAGAFVVSHPINMGYGESIKSSFAAAKTNQADILVTLDGDGQHNPDEIPAVLAPILRGESDLVIGSRFLSIKNKIPRYRKFGIDVITFIYNFGSRLKVSDAQSGFRAYTREVLDAFPVIEKGMGVSVEVITKARRRGFRIKEVPISCIYHSESSSLNPVRHGLGVALTTLKLRLKRD